VGGPRYLALPQPKAEPTGGRSSDPETHIAYVYSQRSLSNLGLVEAIRRVPIFPLFGKAAPRDGRRFGMGRALERTALAAPGICEGRGAKHHAAVKACPLFKRPMGPSAQSSSTKAKSLADRVTANAGQHQESSALKGLKLPRTGRNGITRTLVTG